MATEGAVQIDVTVNNQSITIKKDHVVSLSIQRVIGDSADEFTLEVYDETAWKLENALMMNKLAPISVRYSVSSDLSKSVLFAGTCLSYQLSFVGKSVMLTITGILASSTGDDTGYWFDKRAIEWVGDLDTIRDANDNVIEYLVDGKGQSEYANFEENEDVCAFVNVPLKEDGTPSNNPIVYYNPSRIFKRIIHKYNGDIVGSTKVKDSYDVKGSGGAVLNNNADTVYDYLLDNGFTSEAACGIMGNIMAESSFNYKADNGTHYGLCQWSKTYYPQMNRASFTTQYQFIPQWMESEFDVFNKNYKGISLNDFKNLNYAEDAAEAFFRIMERAGDSSLLKRQIYAKGYYNYYVIANRDKSEVVRIQTWVESTVNTSAIGWGTGGTGSFKLGEVDESRWIAGLDRFQQSNETAAQYINRVLCKAAITNTYSSLKNEIAGFQYYIKNGKHYFKALNYADSTTNMTTVKVGYGIQDSNVISFSMNKIGALAMVGVNSDNDETATSDSSDNPTLDASTMDYFTSDLITANGENIFGTKRPDLESGEDTSSEDNAAYQNWYSGKFTNVKVSSSSSQSELNSTLSSTWSDLANLTYTAELTIWADCSNKFAPGNYIDLIVMGNEKKHYSSGVYYIIQIQDNISMDGYTQSMKLIKRPRGVESSFGITDAKSSFDNSIYDAKGNVISKISTLPDIDPDTYRQAEIDAYRAEQIDIEEDRQNRLAFLKSQMDEIKVKMDENQKNPMEYLRLRNEYDKYLQEYNALV